MINHQRRAIFVHIQKSGGNSITDAFGESVDAPGKHRTAIQIREVVSPDQWNSYFKFSFVRNPWDRLVSWWSMIDGQRQHWQAGGYVNDFARFVLTNAGSFDELLALVDARREEGRIIRGAIDDSTDAGCIQKITRNQIDYLTDVNGDVLVDFVGRFERIHDDFAVVSSKVFDRAVTLGHRNRSNRQPDYRGYYTPASQQVVGRWFERDVHLLGYGF